MSIERHVESRVVQPIGATQARLPQHGRIRTGHVPKGKKFPSSLRNFRLTSPDRDALEHLANQYGGEVTAWSNPKANPPNQFELLTKSDVLAVQLVPASVKLAYEMWAGGFLRRRCDGLSVVARKKGTGKNPTEEALMPCICNQQQDLKCSPVTRLNVILPGIPFRGTWMLQSSGWNVFAEMPGVAQLIEQQAPGQLIPARLRLGKRIADGGAKEFVVPVIELDQELQSLADGKREELMAAAQDEPPPALEAADPLAFLEDDEVMDAEIVDD